MSDSTGTAAIVKTVSDIASTQAAKQQRNAKRLVILKLSIIGGAIVSIGLAAVYVYRRLSGKLKLPKIPNPFENAMGIADSPLLKQDWKAKLVARISDPASKIPFKDVPKITPNLKLKPVKLPGKFKIPSKPDFKPKVKTPKIPKIKIPKYKKPKVPKLW